MKPYILTFITIVIIFSLTKLPYKVGGTSEYVDESGFKISDLSDVSSVISLSPTHTENISYIGGDELLVGVSNDSIFPFKVTKLRKYDLSRLYDVELILKNRPSLVLIEPSILKKHRSAISKLESAGITVVNLAPKGFDDFNRYIRTLGQIVHREREVEEKLLNFNRELEELKLEAVRIDNKKSAFIELSEKGYFTASKNSFISDIFDYAGVDLIIPKSNFFDSDSEIKKVGFDFILDNSETIDIYFTLSGAGYSGASKVSILQNKKYKPIGAISNGRLYELSFPFIGNKTFRVLDGIREIRRLSYNSVNTLDKLESEVNLRLDRITFAKLLYYELNLQAFTVTDSDYYKWDRFTHTYGAFNDVSFTDDDFNIIETVVNLGFIKPKIDSSGVESFNRKTLLTTEDIDFFRMMTSD